VVFERIKKCDDSKWVKKIRSRDPEVSGAADGFDYDYDYEHEHEHEHD
jgi:hypothetical protein